MKAEPDKVAVSDILDPRKKQMPVVDAEHQRGGMVRASFGVVSVLTAITCAGCQPPPPPRVIPETRVQPECKRGSAPAIGSTAVSRVGESLYAEDNYCWIEKPKKPDLQAPKAVVPNGLQWSRGNGQHATIPPGSELTRQFYNGTYAYCTTDGVFRDLLGPSRVVCLMDRDVDGFFDQMTVVAAVPYTTAISPTAYTTPSASGKRPVDVDIVEGDRKELVYEGLLDKQVKLLYREYSERLARPAFFQEVTYDYRAGDDIQFQDVKIRILEANRNEIRYQVLSGWRSSAAGTENGEE